MSNYVFRTPLTIDECIERFHASVDHGIFSKRRHHPEWEFEGNVRGWKFWLRRRPIVHWKGIPIHLSFGERIFYGSLFEQVDKTLIHVHFRHPRVVIVARLFYLFPILAGGFLWFITLASLWGAQLVDPPLDTHGRLLLFAIGSLFVPSPILLLSLQHTVARRIERENNPKMIAFIQRTFAAELIEPAPTNSFVA